MKRFEHIDVGTLLPGCSVPVALVDGKAVHAFREFRPLPIDGLSPSARLCVTQSIPGMVTALNRLHDGGYVDGRITSAKLHNHGTDSAPAATLWIDPSEVETEVHAGDPEAMYWTQSRLQSGADAKPADDWYAMGIALAECVLTSEAVRKIWELSQQDGRFVENLTKNVKHARSPRGLKRASLRLIREGSAGDVAATTIQTLSTPAPVSDRKWVYVMLAVSVVLFASMLWGGFRQNAEIGSRDKQLVALEKRVDELQTRADELASRPPQVITVAEEKGEPSQGRAGQSGSSLATLKAQWKEDVSDRPLDEVVRDAATLQPAEWVRHLAEIHAMAGQKQWRVLDSRLRRDVQRVVNQPWDDGLRDAVRQRLESLGAAQRKWQSWARSGKSLPEIQTQHGLMPSGLEKDYLGGWLGELLDVRELDLTVRVLEVPQDNEFSAHVIALENEEDELKETWEWPSASGEGASIRLVLDSYRPDQSIGFWVQQDSSIPYWNTTVLEHTFTSPMVVWQLQKGLNLSNSESGYSLQLSTRNQIGPPVSLNSERLENVLSSPVRKVVDPLKELPIGLD